MLFLSKKKCLHQHNTCFIIDYTSIRILFATRFENLLSYFVNKVQVFLFCYCHRENDVIRLDISYISRIYLLKRQTSDEFISRLFSKQIWSLLFQFSKYINLYWFTNRNVLSSKMLTIVDNTRTVVIIENVRVWRK